MMVLHLIMIVVVVAMAPISSAFGLKVVLHLRKLCSEAIKHILDHVIGPNAKNAISQFRWQMTVSEMPCDAQQLLAILMSDLDQRLDSGSDL
jgi:hypothetical protein